MDLEGPPTNFTYVNESKPAPGIEIPDDPVIGCECENCLDVSNFSIYTEFNYNKKSTCNSLFCYQ